ncbi:hypothetical protein HLRTI_001087 [Halorhabdus tiamatea SARL4B]|uniref:Profilin fold domain-containing protein n=1 Tax=Halorhabdus tiamatea SARL4B TaxID=1033806 RepID=U2E3H3_9EURY|nr:hypothetical protein [Halorhabdus tiamatea]ERJ06828.1 hypothetical protein HLRTI_001087 [Halorhabdus tiamatea SARL4B]
MTSSLDSEIVGTEAAAERRDEVVAAVTEHAGRIARELARLQGGDYGQADFETDAGTWTLKYEAGDVQYLRFAGRGADVYVVSTQQPPEPDALATAMADYDAFVAAFNEHVCSLAGVLDDVGSDFPAVESVDALVAERERILGQMREATDAMARQLQRYEGGDYGTFATRVTDGGDAAGSSRSRSTSGSRWELKWEDGRTSYLRVGGEGGIYLLSQYQPPSARDLRAHAPDFPGFVAAFNEEIAAESDSLEDVSL